MTDWAAIEQALQKLDCTRKGRIDTALYELKLKAVAAVREAKRRESELERSNDQLRELSRNWQARYLDNRNGVRGAEARVAELERALDDTWADVSVLLDQHVSREVVSEARRRLIGRAAAREDVSSIDTEYADTHRALHSETKDALNLAVERAETAENARRKLRWRRARREATGE